MGTVVDEIKQSYMRKQSTGTIHVGRRIAGVAARQQCTCNPAPMSTALQLRLRMNSSGMRDRMCVKGGDYLSLSSLSSLAYLGKH